MRANPPRQLAGARADPPEEGGLRATGAASDAFVSGLGASCRPQPTVARAMRADPPRQLAGARFEPLSGFGANRRPWPITVARAVRADSTGEDGLRESFVLGAAVLANCRGSLRQSGSTALSGVCRGSSQVNRFASDTP
jgi:hypothetical protein